jgi:3-oxoacyl-[acyl-carrier protein] reductase
VLTTKFDFTDRIAVVTGGANGIGRATALALAEAGAKTAILDLDRAGGTETKDQIRAAGGDASFVACDVTQSTSVETAFAGVVDRFGGLDLLVNSAGGFTRKLGIEETSDEEWHRVLHLNLTSAFLCTRAAVPIMKRKGRGAIVNIGSVAGLTSSTASPPYACAKAGVHSLARQVALELAPYGITCNNVAPGTTSTARVDDLHGESGMQRIAAANPMGRIAQVGDTVGAILFLCSTDASYITGQTLSVDGGRLMV